MSKPPPSTGTTTVEQDLAQCGHVNPTQQGKAEGPSLRVSPSIGSAGENLNVAWAGVDGLNIIVGDEIEVSCWTGDGWDLAFGVARAFSSDPSMYYFTDSTNAYGQDGFYPVDLIIPISEFAPPGSYRLEVIGTVCEPECSELVVSVGFEVDR